MKVEKCIIPSTKPLRVNLRLKLDVNARARKRTAGYKCCFSYFNFDEHVEQIAPLIRVKTEKACRHRILFTDTVRNT